MATESTKTSTAARPPAVAGLFYPDDPDELQRTVGHCFRQAAASHLTGRPRALIVPHAGLVYSGPIAASAYATLRPWAEEIRRVVLVGPSHWVSFRGVAVTGARRWAAPGGFVEIDSDGSRRLVDQGLAVELEQAHAREHALEVQLPFLMSTLKKFSLLPLVVGDADDEDVTRVLDAAAADNDDTLLVISSDLSHYQDYDTATRLDAGTSEAILALNPALLEGSRACGHRPVRGLLRWARQRGWTPEVLDRRNSGDTAGDRSRVVGYGAWAFLGPEDAATG